MPKGRWPAIGVLHASSEWQAPIAEPLEEARQPWPRHLPDQHVLDAFRTKEPLAVLCEQASESTPSQVLNDRKRFPVPDSTRLANLLRECLR